MARFQHHRELEELWAPALRSCGKEVPVANLLRQVVPCKRGPEPTGHSNSEGMPSSSKTSQKNQLATLLCATPQQIAAWKARPATRLEVLRAKLLPSILHQFLHRGSAGNCPVPKHLPCPALPLLQGLLRWTDKNTMHDSAGLLRPASRLDAWLAQHHEKETNLQHILPATFNARSNAKSYCGELSWVTHGAEMEDPEKRPTATAARPSASRLRPGGCPCHGCFLALSHGRSPPPVQHLTGSANRAKRRRTHGYNLVHCKAGTFRGILWRGVS